MLSLVCCICLNYFINVIHLVLTSSLFKLFPHKSWHIFTQTSYTIRDLKGKVTLTLLSLTVVKLKCKLDLKGRSGWYFIWSI